MEADGATDAVVELVDAFFNAMLGGGDDLGGGGGRWSAEVGYKVGYGEVGLVADSGDGGDPGSGNDAGEGFVVEAGEVFHGASAACDEDEVSEGRFAVEKADSGCHRRGARWALHDGGVDQQVERGVTAADDGDDVADDGAGGRSNDADGTGEGRQRSLAGGVEEAFREQAGLELFKGELNGASTSRLEGIGDELELAAGFVYGDAAAREDGETVGGAKAKELGLAAEEDDRELRVGVLEGEVDVSGGSGAAIGDLAFDPEVCMGGFNLPADSGDERGDGPDAAFRRLGFGRLWGAEETGLALGGTLRSPARP
jgi:hypothetical protein